MDVVSNMSTRIVDAFTNRTDMTPQQKWAARNPSKRHALQRANYARNKNNAQKYYERNKGKWGEAYEKDKPLRDTRSAAWRVKTKYGLTLEEYTALRLQPCEVCGSSFPDVVMCIDHSIEGSYHGVLCHGCNVAIGHLRHDPTRIERAAQYVRRTRDHGEGAEYSGG